MARLFISHSSWNSDKAVEVRDWLAKNGWNDVFLDLDPERGIVAGQRWKEALQKAAWRCEVVLALVSKEWVGSSWCKSEVDAARLMGKKVIAALIGIDKSEVPRDLTDEQFIDLTGDPDAYRRLKVGLERAGLDPTSFPFPPDRRPYPGFAFLKEEDAAVFFGRDAQIVRGLDDIRRLARTGVTRMLVILGASGSGKSSFLRAGLWPRLKRDDLAWLPLPIVRPERSAISGAYGLAAALCQIAGDPRFSDGMRQRVLPRSRADIQDFIEKTDDGVPKILAALRDIAHAGFSSDNAPPPTVLLAIDQGEELFNEEGRDESKRLIDILMNTLAADPRTMAILVTRSDAFPLVQSDPALAALPKDTFTLDMMLEGSFRAVIEGPARLVEPPLAVDPELIDALLEDISGQDALPLLAFTLAHLYDSTRADDALTLAGYDKIGRVKGVIEKTVAQAFAEAVARGEAPKTKEEQAKLARSAFIPHLAQVNATGQFVRRVAPREKIPTEARPLIDRFAEQRLLIRDRRQDAEVIEVAHEALLRQPPFSDWLGEDREFLQWRDRLTQARTAFEVNQRGLLAGRELEIARDWKEARAEREFEPADLAFIRESVAADDKRRADEAEERRKKEAAEKDEQERRIRDAEWIAEEQKNAASAQRRFTWAAAVGLVIAVGLAAAVGWQYLLATRATKEAFSQRDRAVQAEDTAKAEKLAAEANADSAKVNLREAQKARQDATQERNRAIASTSSLLSVRSAEELRKGDAGTALLLALEGLRNIPTEVPAWTTEDVRKAAIAAYNDLREIRIIRDVSRAAISADGIRVVVLNGENTVSVKAIADGRDVGPKIKLERTVVKMEPAGPNLVRVVYDDHTVETLSLQDGAKTAEPSLGAAPGRISCDTRNPEFEAFVQTDGTLTIANISTMESVAIRLPVSGKKRVSPPPKEGSVACEIDVIGRTLIFSGAVSQDQRPSLLAASGWRDSPQWIDLQGEDFIGLVVNPDGSSFSAIKERPQADSILSVKDLRSKKLIGASQDLGFPTAGSATYSGRGGFLAVNVGNKTIEIFDANGRPLPWPMAEEVAGLANVSGERKAVDLGEIRTFQGYENWDRSDDYGPVFMAGPIKDEAGKDQDTLVLASQAGIFISASLNPLERRLAFDVASLFRIPVKERIDDIFQSAGGRVFGAIVDGATVLWAPSRIRPIGESRWATLSLDPQTERDTVAKAACEVLTRGLTREQRTRYALPDPGPAKDGETFYPPPPCSAEGRLTTGD